MLAGIRPALGFVVLVLAVHHFVHALLQQTVVIDCKQRIPVPTPDDLDHIPAGTAETAFQFLNDFAVTANRTIESLQIAVDDENQIVELLRPAMDKRTQTTSGSSHSPSPRNAQTFDRRAHQAAVVQVFHDVRLIDRLERPRPMDTVGNCQ